MLFGQSLFQSVLDRLDAEEDLVEKEETVHRPRGLKLGFAVDVREGVSAAASRPDDAYADNLGEEFILSGAAMPEPEPPKPEQPEPEPPVMPDYLLRTSPEDVAAELAISGKDTVQSLNEKRRAFAKRNHPDSVAPPFRDNATQRMTVANLLIDQAIRRLGR